MYMKCTVYILILCGSINPQLGLFDLSGLYLKLRKFFCALIQQLEPGVQRKCPEERLSKANKGIVINLSIIIALNQIYLSLAPLTRLLIKGGYAGAKPCYYLEQISLTQACDKLFGNQMQMVL